MQNIKSVTMYSTSWCADCFRAKQFFKEYNIAYREIDIEQNPEYAGIVEKINNGNRSVPTIIVEYVDPNQPSKTLVEPSREQLSSIFFELK